SKYANLKAAHSSANAQDELYQAALQNLFVRVTGAYFTVLTDEDLLANAKANEDAFKQQFEQADQRFKVGLSAITDVYQAKSFYEAAKATTIAAQNTLDNDREALSQITGKPTGNLKKLRDELPMNSPDPADPDAWVKQALINNPNLLAQKQNVAAAEHNITAARAGHLPPAHDHRERQLRQERELVRERRDPFQHAVADHDRAHPQRADLLRWSHPVARAA